LVGLRGVSKHEGATSSLFETRARVFDADVFRIPPWILIAVNGFLALVALAALVGIWFGR